MFHIILQHYLGIYLQNTFKGFISLKILDSIKSTDLCYNLYINKLCNKGLLKLVF